LACDLENLFSNAHLHELPPLSTDYRITWNRR